MLLIIKTSFDFTFHLLQIWAKPPPTKNSVAAMNGKFGEHRPLAHAQHLAIL
jgi:hypothetical protein